MYKSKYEMRGENKHSRINSRKEKRLLEEKTGGDWKKSCKARRRRRTGETIELRKRRDEERLLEEGENR